MKTKIIRQSDIKINLTLNREEALFIKLLTQNKLLPLEYDNPIREKLFNALPSLQELMSKK